MCARKRHAFPRHCESSVLSTVACKECLCLCAMLMRRTRACACGTPANVPAAYTFARRNEQRALACMYLQASHTRQHVNQKTAAMAPQKQMHVYHCEWHCPDIVYLGSNISNV
eukprot:1515428-Pleurochrysis_carterae.AAC.1